MILVTSFAAIGGRSGREQLFDIDRIEAIRAVAEVAAHLDLAALGEHGADLLGSRLPSIPITRSREHRQRKYTGADSNSRTSSSANSRRRISRSLSACSSSPRKVSAEQLHAPPCVVDLVPLRAAPRPVDAGARRTLSSDRRCSSSPEAPFSRRMQPQPRRQLLRGLEVFAQAIGEAPAAQRHDALVALRQILVLQRHRQIAFARQRGKVAPSCASR